jgi:tetratricopeptide (TPR) repeat protein
MIMNRIAGMHAATGENKRAIELHSRALALAQKAGNVPLEAATRGNLGRVHFESKNWAASRQEFEHALRLFKDMGDKRGQALSLLGLGRLDVATGHEFLRSAAAMFHEIGDTEGEQTALEQLPEAEPPQEAKVKPA